MKPLSIRDVIGPIMIGPSSSHTAGALRIALMCRGLLSARPQHVRFKLYGSFARTYRGHGTDRALVAGMLGMQADDEHIRDSFALAHEAGLDFTFEPVFATTGLAHPNTVCIEVDDADGQRTTMRGESIGGGAAVISRLNGIDVHLSGEYHSIVVKQHDRSGVLAHIATSLSASEINIATTRMFRKKKGAIAYTIMETDDAIDETIAAALMAHPDIIDVRVIRSETAATANSETCPDTQREDVERAQQAFERLDFENATALLAYCSREDVPLSKAMCARERAMLVMQGRGQLSTRRYLHRVLDVMRASATAPIEHVRSSMGGLLGGEARALHAAESAGPADALLARACTYAAAVLETNASMGRIVAAPTAGASGVLPAVLLALQDARGADDERLVDALANAAAIGYLATRNATVSGAEGGCQAEVGTASAMAASAACELLGGTPAQCLDAASNALVSLMGLVCDPVAGLVEVPCQKRNVTGAAVALASAQMACAGVANAIGFDETLEATRRVGRGLPAELRETALGGLAATPSACALCENLASRGPEAPFGQDGAGI